MFRKLLAGLATVATVGALTGTAAASATPTPPLPVSFTPSTPARVSSAESAELASQLRSGTLAARTGVATCASVTQQVKVLCNLAAVTASKGTARQLSSGRPFGYGARELQKAYRLSNAPSQSGTVAIIDAGADPTLEADLGVYRTQYGLPACTTLNGCFKQERLNGGSPYKPVGDGDVPGTPLPWTYIEQLVAEETALDVQMASAACPKCKILEIQVPLVDALGLSRQQVERSAADFATAVQLAHTQGASAVSISYGLPNDVVTDTGDTAKKMRVPGTAIYASSGDSGYDAVAVGGESWPADLSSVIAAGGTSLYGGQDTATGFAQTAWAGAGSGCAPNVRPASGQPAIVASYCTGHRAATDISSVADPATGVAIYDTWAPYDHEPLAWVTVGGTSAAAPFLAGMNARAGVQKSVTGPNVLYAAPRGTYDDVTLGTNASVPGTCENDGVPVVLCNARAGWDGPTGLGSPRGLSPFYTY